MEGVIRISPKCVTISALCLGTVLIFLFCGSCVEAYKNYTVGDSLGWYDNLPKSSVSYQKWAAGKTFTLGDFLIFNTNTNCSVVQTYNFTTYKRCDFEDAETDDTTEWSAADPSSTTPQQVTVPVPLVKEGMNYFFSGDYDGEQCKNGQHFKINVTHGQGLPPSLHQQQPSSSSIAPSSSDGTDDGGDATPQPDTVVSSSFDHPKADDDDAKIKKTSVSGSLSGSYTILLLGLMWSLMLVTY